MNPNDKAAVEALAARLDHIRRAVTHEGREVLAAAVRIEHDWALEASSVDMQIEALAGLSDNDLEAAYLLAQRLVDATGCLLIRRHTDTSGAGEQR